MNNHTFIHPISVKLTKVQLNIMDDVIKKGYFSSRAEILRTGMMLLFINLGIKLGEIK